MFGRSAKSGFPKIRFRGKLRANQKDAVAAIKRDLKAGKSRLHIVAPPGSGKTVLGLYTWAELVKRPAVVLSPTSAIQSQWISRLDLFDTSAMDDLHSDDSAAPGLLTSLTYQSLTLPKRGGDDLEAAARVIWTERLVENGEADDVEEAQLWIVDMEARNPDYFRRRLKVYRKEVLEGMTRSGRSLDALHASARGALERLRDRDVGLVILDECHHLLGHWGRVLDDAHELLAEPIVLALTATPPDGRGTSPQDFERYSSFLGPVDFEIPVPAVVKAGLLAPYQDLVQFVRPEPEELGFIASADERLQSILEQVERGPDDDGSQAPVDPSSPPRCPPLLEWVESVLAGRLLPTGAVKDWTAFVRRDRALADAGRLLLEARGRTLPATVPEIEPDVREGVEPEEVPFIMLDRYVRHGLRRSTSPDDHALAEEIVGRLRILGVQITETGSQACASPVSRVLGYSRAKADAAVRILQREMDVLGPRIRAVVIADYETSAANTTSAPGVLDNEAGGAVAVFRAIVSDQHTDGLQPALVTGSTILLDDDAVPAVLAGARAWLAAAGANDVELVDESMEGGFHRLVGRGEAWMPRTYVAMLTHLFQEGVIRCLVGTRGLLGEGWDASRINVLIDLTTVTTSMTVNQLRGRSIRLDAKDPKKLADNWDVICIADEFVKGLADYHRFRDRHSTWYGVTEDGQVEKGVGHVHPAFTDVAPEGVSELIGVFNDEMLQRAGMRDDARKRWRIGERFDGIPAATLEARVGDGGGGFPPFGKRGDPWSQDTLATAIASAVHGALVATEQISATSRVRTGARAGGWVRLLLEKGTPEDVDLFLHSMDEVLGPLDRPRYVIERVVTDLHPTLLSRMLPDIVGRYFRKRRARLAMVHALPTALARNKDLAAAFERSWNEHVSPGEAVYALHGRGEELVAEARAGGLAPAGVSRMHEVFH
ncbi:MAG: DEAD/DEAH box helicase [Planctomycetota bacterium]|jgi:superfamily II DNA or RNA helicase